MDPIATPLSQTVNAKSAHARSRCSILLRNQSAGTTHGWNETSVLLNRLNLHLRSFLIWAGLRMVSVSAISFAGNEY